MDVNAVRTQMLHNIVELFVLSFEIQKTCDTKLMNLKLGTKAVGVEVFEVLIVNEEHSVLSVLIRCCHLVVLFNIH